MLLVEHDIGLVMGISDAVNCLDYGKLIACGTAKQVQADEAVIAAYLGDGKSTVSRESLSDSDLTTPDNLLVVDGVTTSYGTIEALHGVSLVVPKGQIVAVLGANGAGKTTLLETISGLLHPGTGHIHYQGAEITKLAPHRIARRGSGHVPEGRQALPHAERRGQPHHGIAGTRGKGGAPGRHRFRLRGVPRTRRAPYTARGHPVRRRTAEVLAIGRALTGKPSLLLLDEPSMGLAPLTVDRIFEGLVKLNEQGLTMLMVEQNAEMALSIADQAVVLQTGNVVLAEKATSLRADDRVRESYLGRGPGA